MPEVIQLGLLHLNTQLLLLLLSGMFAYGVVHFKAKEENKGYAEINLVWNAATLILFIWKISYFFLHPLLTIKHPSYLLYFSGGTPGLVFGTIAAGLYVLIALSRTHASASSLLFTGTLSGTAFYMFYEGVHAFYEKSIVSAAFSTVSCGIFFVLFFMKNKLFHRLSSLVLAALVLLSLEGTAPIENKKLPAAEAGVSGLKRGNTPPDFKLNSLDGKTISLSQYKGKTVFLNFWASWCPPCQAEMPEMQRFYKEHRSKDVVILAVNLTSEDSREAAKTFAKKHHVTFPVLYDEKGKVGGKYHAFTLPTTYVIDKSGTIAQLHIGPLNADMMESLIQ
ncbi:peroxiredoxin family protein [Fictibacillus sp. FJAT-27399]|uniref:peroxiredoxin family protein n=1 Tax=Fictibacillus sp. FJAT-27399 TaxID=1729689 RepID=UPI000782634B|nr:TlpA disulfide reductase family protein [Fictibacillus sp. FJAT-27399]